jgi:hypothetical protein
MFMKTIKIGTERVIFSLGKASFLLITLYLNLKLYFYVTYSDLVFRGVIRFSLAFQMLLFL